jgi:hypothetical protein
LDVIFTIVSRNYAAQAATLMESLAKAEPGVRRVVIATDGPIPHLADRAEVIEAQDLGAPLKSMSVYYDALELNTAVKPFVFKSLLTQPGVTGAVYLDPDIQVFRPLDAVRAGLAEAQLVLTPHVTRPLLGEASPNDQDHLRSGTYNLGFAAMRREDKTLALLDWWADRCRFDCRVDLKNGLFTDQKWMDLSPGFVDSVHLIRDPGLNLAYWNIEGRSLSRGSDGWSVDGRPLVFFHYSGFDPRRPRTLSKHQNRVQVEPGSPLADLLEDYAQAMLRNGHDETSRIPYAHNRFASGRPVGPLMRRTALAAARRGQDFSGGLDEAVSAWFDQPSPEAAVPGLPDVTRVMDQLWRDAPAADPFDRGSVEGRAAFHRWFADNSEALGADVQSVQAAQAMLTSVAAARTADGSVWSDPPWTGPSNQAVAWLRTPATDGPPRAAKALLAARKDLRERFGADETALVAWCLGPEAAAGRFAAELLPEPLLASLAQDPGLLFEAARLADPSRGGGDLRRRLQAGFGIGERARWPAALVQPLRAPWLRSAPGRPAPFPMLFQAIWESRPDLQRLYPLESLPGRLKFLRWLLAGGFAEYGVEPAALPAEVREHPLMRAARLSMRRRHPVARSAARPAPARGQAEHLVVVEVVDTLPDLGGATVIYEGASSRFLTPRGGPAAPPQLASRAYFLTEPALVPADAVVLYARGVTWSRAVGVWSPEVAGRLSSEDVALGFVDSVVTQGAARADLPRPAEAPRGGIEAALAAFAAR